MTDWKAEEGDRFCDSNGHWGSILEATGHGHYKARLDYAPTETYWICDSDIERLHRGAGPDK